MRILYIVQRFHTNLYWRLKALAEAGHEVFVLANQEKEGERRDPKIKSIVLKEPKNADFWKNLGSKSHLIYFDIPDLGDLKAKIKEIKPEVIVARNLNSLRTIFSFVYARSIKAKLFTEAQTQDYYFTNFFKRLLVKTAAKFLKIKGLITPLKNRLAKSDKFFKYLPFVVPAPDFNKTNFAGGHINLLAVGKYIPRKDHATLLAAVKILAPKYDIRLTIVGQHNTPASQESCRVIEESIKAEQLATVVEMKNNLPHETMAEVYRQHDLFVLPAYNEPASYSVLEAMAAKLPVIASDTCGTSCYIKEGESGYVFKSHSAESLAQKIELIIKDREELIKMGEKSFALARDFHSPALFVREFEKICLEK